MFIGYRLLSNLFKIILLLFALLYKFVNSVNLKLNVDLVILQIHNNQL